MNTASFFGGMGRTARGMTEATRDMTAERQQQQLEQMRANQMAAQQAQIQNQRTAAAILRQGTEMGDMGVQGYEIGRQDSAPQKPAPVTTGGGTVVPPAPRASQADVRGVDNEIARVQELRKVDAQRNQKINDRKSLAAPFAAAADVVTAPVRAAGTLADKVGGAANRISNAVTGGNLNTDPNTFRQFTGSGAAPYYDKYVRSDALGKTTPEAKVNTGQMAPDAQKWVAGQQNSPALASAVKQVESGGNPNAVSPKGAVGTMQTMPTTLTSPGFGVAPARDNSPQEQERVGVDYLNAMVSRYKDQNVALAAYNWGPGNVDKWLQAGANPAQLPQETQQYITKVNKGLLSPTATPPAPAVQQATSAQPTPPTEPAKQYAIPQLNPQQDSFYAQQRRQQYNQAVQLLNTINPAAPGGMEIIMQARMQIDQLKLGEFSAGVSRLASSAGNGDLNSLSKLAELYRRETGHDIQLVQDGQQIVAVDRNGRPAFSGSSHDLATKFWGEVDQAIKQKLIAQQETVKLEYLKEQAKASATNPYELQKIAARGATQRALQWEELDQKLQHELIMRGVEANDVKFVTADPVSGGFLITPKIGKPYPIAPTPAPATS